MPGDNFTRTQTMIRDARVCAARGRHVDTHTHTQTHTHLIQASARPSESYAISLMTYVHTCERERKRGDYFTRSTCNKVHKNTSVTVSHMRRDEDTKRAHLIPYCRPLPAKLRHSGRCKPRNFVDPCSATRCAHVRKRERETFAADELARILSWSIW